MTSKRKQLLFRDVDGLAFAAAHGRLQDAQPSVTYVPNRLGPLLELMQLYAGGRLPHPGSWLELAGTAPLVSALEQAKGGWVSSTPGHAGFIRTTRPGSDGDSRFTGFLMNAKRACRQVASLPAETSGKLVAAMKELENNIHEHADAPETGILAYRAEPGAFEFVVADRGIGILNSLRRYAAYAALPDEGKALEAALTDGVSRFGPNSNRGYGFRPIFIGLMNLHGELRFRSGDHALTMDGTSPTLTTSRISQKAPLDGFFASVRCHAKQRRNTPTPMEPSSNVDAVEPLYGHRRWQCNRASESVGDGFRGMEEVVRIAMDSGIGSTYVARFATFPHAVGSCVLDCPCCP